MKKHLTFILLTAILLTGCSESESDDSYSAAGASTVSTVESITDESSESEAEVSEYVSLVKTGENTVKSSNDTLECEYTFRKTDNFIQVIVNYTNISDESIMANYMPRVYIDGTEVEENTYGDEFYHMTGIGPGEVYTNVYEYDLIDGEEAYLVLQVFSDVNDSYTSDNSENNREDFTISLS